jgi:hypothetical protein
MHVTKAWQHGSAIPLLTLARILSLAIPLLVFVLRSLPAHASQLSVLAGATEGLDTGDASYSWQADFRYDFLRNFAASLSWINEGHLKEHRRDGYSGQALAQVPLLDKRLSIGIGAGVYRFFDTRLLPDGNHENVHGWAPIYSLTATYDLKKSWFARFAFNHIHPAGDFDSNTYLIGVGYRLWKEAEPPAGPGNGTPLPKTTGYEMMPFLGQVVVNSPRNETGIGSGVEFRMGIDENLDWSVTLLNENVSRTIRRTGLGTQIWLVDAFLERRITLGFGAGLYAFVDAEPPADAGAGSRLDIAGLVTVTTSYRFSDHWFTRFNWDRVESNDNRDSDIFLLGVGYRWYR